jgi:hypothetical protein
MGYFEKKIVITYKWWEVNTKNGEINPEHQEALEETAKEHIFTQIKEGFVSGELFDNIHMTDDDPEDGISYQGTWDSDEE